MGHMESNPTEHNEGALATLDRGFIRRVTTLNPRAWVTNNVAGVHNMTRNYPFQSLNVKNLSRVNDGIVMDMD